MKQFFVLTLFPEMIEQTLSHSIMGRAQKEGHISVEAVNIRDFTLICALILHAFTLQILVFRLK